MFDRESRRQRRLIGFGLGVVLLFCVSGVKSCTELRYTLSGTTTNATIQKVYEDGRKQVVMYKFQEPPGTWNRGSARVPAEWQRPEDNSVEVIYLPSNPDISTTPSSRSLAFPLIFGAMFLALVGWIVVVCVSTKRALS